MAKRKKINLWLDRDLAQTFQKLNKQINKPFFEHQLVSFFLTYHISYIHSYEPLSIAPESFTNPEKAAKTVSKIIARMKYINKQMKTLTEELDFLGPFLQL